MARVIGAYAQFWDGIDRHTVRYRPYAGAGMVEWLCSPDQPGFFCWWNSLGQLGKPTRLVGFSDPDTALAFKLRWG